MPAFANEQAVVHSADQMFDLVADVERYPEFVPMCERLAVRRRREAGKGVETLIADMTVGYLLISETFTTKVRLDRPGRQIDVSYVEGPFRHLDNHWRFESAAKGCIVRFSIDYEFKSRVFEILAGAMFETLFRRMTAAFLVRADEIYGKRR